ncbi:F-box protein CPR1-like [Cornus florida]|uniref:F-box protein CPR1-like n=1 Tax=Cornus florida TaxID=4283 RepID=UPI00289AB33A|nr:F-box protein CPR1-like [Cornus florida]
MHSPGYYRIVGSCNGLICLSNDLYGNESYTTVVWNPAIRKTLHVPDPPSVLPNRLKYGAVGAVVGFGFNSWTNDFKIIKMVHYRDSNLNIILPAEVEVYEIKTGLWRGSRAVVPPYDMTPKSCSDVRKCVFVKGASHWLAIEAGEEQDSYLILSFDMMLPGTVSNGSRLKMSISLFGESLSLFHKRMDFPFPGWCMWVMKDYGIVESWMNLFTFKEPIERVLGFRGTGEVVVTCFHHKLASFDTASKKETDLGIRWSRKDLLYLDTYMESLVLLDQGLFC